MRSSTVNVYLPSLSTIKPWFSYTYLCSLHPFLIAKLLIKGVAHETKLVPPCCLFYKLLHLHNLNTMEFRFTDTPQRPTPVLLWISWLYPHKLHYIQTPSTVDTPLFNITDTHWTVVPFWVGAIKPTKNLRFLPKSCKFISYVVFFLSYLHSWPQLWEGHGLWPTQASQEQNLRAGHPTIFKRTKYLAPMVSRILEEFHCTWLWSTQPIVWSNHCSTRLKALHTTWYIPCTVGCNMLESRSALNTTRLT